MRAGDLRHRVLLQRPIHRQNDYGAAISDWESVATVWAEVKPISGREFFSAHQVQSEITTQIWLRYREGITPQMRVKHRKQTYQILSVINTDEKNRSIQLLCKELINGNH